MHDIFTIITMHLMSLTTLPSIYFPNFHKIGTNMNDKNVASFYGSGAHPLDTKAVDMYEAFSNYLKSTTQIGLIGHWLAIFCESILWYVATGLQYLYVKLFGLFEFSTWHTNGIAKYIHDADDFGLGIFFVIFICYVTMSIFQTNAYRRYKIILRNTLVIVFFLACLPYCMAVGGRTLNSIAKRSPENDYLNNFATRIVRDNVVSVPYRLIHAKPGEKLFDNNSRYVVPMTNSGTRGIRAVPVMLNFSNIDDGSSQAVHEIGEWNGLDKENVPQWLREYGQDDSILGTYGLSRLEKKYGNNLINYEKHHMTIRGENADKFLKSKTGKSDLQRILPRLQAYKEMHNEKEKAKYWRYKLNPFFEAHRAGVHIGNGTARGLEHFTDTHNIQAVMNYERRVQRLKEFQSDGSNITNARNQKDAPKQVKALNDVLTLHLDGSGGDTSVEKFGIFDDSMKNKLGIVRAFRQSYGYYTVNWFSIFTETIVVIIIMGIFIFKLFEIFYKLVIMYFMSGFILFVHGSDYAKIKQWILSLFSLYEVAIVDIMTVYVTFELIGISDHFINYIIYDNHDSIIISNPIVSGIIKLLADFALLRTALKGIDSLNAMMGPSGGGANSGFSGLAGYFGLRALGGVAKGSAKSFGKTAKGVAHAPVALQHGWNAHREKKNKKGPLSGNNDNNSKDKNSSKDADFNARSASKGGGLNHSRAHRVGQVARHPLRTAGNGISSVAGGVATGATNLAHRDLNPTARQFLAHPGKFAKKAGKNFKNGFTGDNKNKNNKNGKPNKPNNNKQNAKNKSKSARKSQNKNSNSINGNNSNTSARTGATAGAIAGAGAGALTASANKPSVNNSTGEGAKDNGAYNDSNFNNPNQAPDFRNDGSNSNNNSSDTGNSVDTGATDNDNDSSDTPDTSNNSNNDDSGSSNDNSTSTNGNNSSSNDSNDNGSNVISDNASQRGTTSDSQVPNVKSDTTTGGLNNSANNNSTGTGSTNNTNNPSSNGKHQNTAGAVQSKALLRDAHKAKHASNSSANNLRPNNLHKSGHQGLNHSKNGNNSKVNTNDNHASQSSRDNDVKNGALNGAKPNANGQKNTPNRINHRVIRRHHGAQNAQQQANNLGNSAKIQHRSKANGGLDSSHQNSNNNNSNNGNNNNHHNGRPAPTNNHHNNGPHNNGGGSSSVTPNNTVSTTGTGTGTTTNGNTTVSNVNGGSTTNGTNNTTTGNVNNGGSTSTTNNGNSGVSNIPAGNNQTTAQNVSSNNTTTSGSNGSAVLNGNQQQNTTNGNSGNNPVNGINPVNQTVPDSGLNNSGYTSSTSKPHYLGGGNGVDYNNAHGISNFQQPSYLGGGDNPDAGTNNNPTGSNNYGSYGTTQTIDENANDGNNSTGGTSVDTQDVYDNSGYGNNNVPNFRNNSSNVNTGNNSNTTATNTGTNVNHNVFGSNRNYGGSYNANGYNNNYGSYGNYGSNGYNNYNNYGNYNGYNGYRSNNQPNNATVNNRNITKVIRHHGHRNHNHRVIHRIFHHRNSNNDGPLKH